jgi:hypothetical protein
VNFFGGDFSKFNSDNREAPARPRAVTTVRTDTGRPGRCPGLPAWLSSPAADHPGHLAGEVGTRERRHVVGLTGSHAPHVVTDLGAAQRDDRASRPSLRDRGDPPTEGDASVIQGPLSDVALSAHCRDPIVMVAPQPIPQGRVRAAGSAPWM